MLYFRCGTPVPFKDDTLWLLDYTNPFYCCCLCLTATVNWAVMLLVERFSVTCMLDFVTLTQLVFTQQMGGLVPALSPMPMLRLQSFSLYPY